ncbi:MAG: hypothetical protein PUB10_04755 [Clostridiales bacterium]|nr:hypothetical protein [Clostridiales bacterium]
MLRYRKKYLIQAALAGAVIIAVPAVIFIAVLFWKNQELQRKEDSQVVGYQLKKDMSSGELVEENCLEEIRVIYAKNHADGEPQGETGQEKMSVSIGDLCGKRLRIALKKGTILTESVLYEGEEWSDDFRVIPFSYIVSDYIEKNQYVDVRIRYENGLDFIILSKKKILDVAYQKEENTGGKDLFMRLSEEEQLRMSCAAVDAYQKKNCTIYAVRYVDEAQNEAVVNYPLSEEILQLMKEDPNIIQIAQNHLSQQYRKVIDALEDRVNDDTLSSSQITEEENLLTGETAEDEVIYFDN